MINYLSKTHRVIFDTNENLISISSSKDSVQVQLEDVLSIHEVSSVGAQQSLFLTACTNYKLVVKLDNKQVEFVFVILDYQKELQSNYRILKYKIAETRSARAKAKIKDEQVP